MIKTFLSILVLCFVFTANAQVVRVGLLGLGGGSLGNTGGITLHVIDINYAPQPRFDAGIYFNFGAGGRTDLSQTEVSVRAGSSVGVQGKFYFLTGKVKPFVGLQLGPQFGAKASTDGTVQTSSAKGGILFQAVPQAGLRLGPLNLWASYANKAIQFNGGFVFGFGNFDR